MGIKRDKDLTEEQREVRTRGNKHTLGGVIFVSAATLLYGRVNSIYVLLFDIVGIMFFIVSIANHSKYFKLIKRDWKKFFWNWRIR